MEIHVYDTYVKAADGHTMHFDVITGEKDHPKAIEFGKGMVKRNRRRRCSNDTKRMYILPLTILSRACRTGN